MPLPVPETSRWFAEEVQPHESELRAYLRSKFSVHLDIDDLVQETYVRLLLAREQTPLRSAKSYLFTTARNAAFDFFRRRKIVAIDGIAELELLPVFEDRPGVAEAIQAAPLPSASTTVKSRNFLTVLTGLLVGVATVPAQTSTAGAPASAVNPPPADTVVLSPFEVTTSSDVGYIATNSLAGSRLNASLKDTPAIIDVFTKEFLADIGATNLEQAMVYANNSQTDDGDTLRVNNGISQIAAGNSYNFRSRGILGNSTRNYFETRLGTDFYSTERLDDSRGRFPLSSAISTHVHRRIGLKPLSPRYPPGLLVERRLYVEVGAN